MGRAIASINGARVSSSPLFYPKHSKEGGGDAPARLVIPTITNTLGWKDKETGARGEGKAIAMLITVFGPFAESLCKIMHKGKEFHCDCTINSYMSKLVKDGHVVLGADQAPIETQKTGYTMIPESLVFGNDAQKVIIDEETKGIRPLGWHEGMIRASLLEGVLNTEGLAGVQNLIERAKQGPALWDAKQKELRAQAYTPGLATFGHAKVMTVNGIQAGSASTQELRIDGFTKADYLKVGWTEDQLKAHPKYSAFYATGPAAPPAPAAPPMPGIPEDGVQHETAGAEV